MTTLCCVKLSGFLQHADATETTLDALMFAQHSFRKIHARSFARSHVIDCTARQNFATSTHDFQ